MILLSRRTEGDFHKAVWQPASKYLWIGEGPTDFVYLPFLQNSRPNMVPVAQAKSADGAALVPVLRRIVQGIDRDMPVYDVRTMQSLYGNRAVATPAVIIKTVAAMGLMGLLLSLVGLYGVVSYSVNRRTREFGIRMAVGACRRHVAAMVLRQGLTLGAIGLGIGLLLGMFATQAITSMMLFSFGRVSVMLFAAVSMLLLIATMLAAYVPARRASLIDPMLILREE